MYGMVRRAPQASGCALSCAAHRPRVPTSMRTPAGDPNRDGTVSKMEFRSNVRSLLGDTVKVDVKGIDALFESLDVDGNGELNAGEFKLALKRLMSLSVKKAKETDAIRTSAEHLRSQAARAQAVADVTVEMERMNEQLLVAKQPPLTVQLGNVMKSKGMKVSDVVGRWGNHEGLVDKATFRREVQLAAHAPNHKRSADTSGWLGTPVAPSQPGWATWLDNLAGQPGWAPWLGTLAGRPGWAPWLGTGCLPSCLTRVPHSSRLYRYAYSSPLPRQRRWTISSTR